MRLSAWLAAKETTFKFVRRHLKSFIFYRESQCGVSVLLGCDAVSLRVWFQTFRRSVVPSSSRTYEGPFNTQGTSCRHCHIPEDLNLELHCENRNFSGSQFGYGKGDVFLFV